MCFLFHFLKYLFDSDSMSHFTVILGSMFGRLTPTILCNCYLHLRAIAMLNSLSTKCLRISAETFGGKKGNCCLPVLIAVLVWLVGQTIHSP